MTARRGVARAVTAAFLLCAAGCAGTLAQPGRAAPDADVPVGPADLAVMYASTPGDSFDIAGVFRRFRRARYGLVVTNGGPGLAPGAMLRVTLRSRNDDEALSLYPADTVVFAAGSGSCNRSRQGSFLTPVIVCRLGLVAPGQRIAVEIGARVHQTGPLYATAEVTSDVADPAPDNNRAQAHTNVTCNGCLRK